LKKAIAFLLLTAILAFALPGARADVEIYKSYVNEATAVQDVLNGKIDMYFWFVPPYMIPKVASNPNVHYYLAAGGIDDILVNPCPTQKYGGPFNPFSIREVRFALNYLINRQQIVSQVLNGYGFPIISPLSPVNPDYLTVINVLAKFNFRYDPAKAKKMITEALTKAGAELINGKWYYHGKPIVIKFMIRNDDPIRKQIGDMLANELEKMGFTVERIYGDFKKALQLVYMSDPVKYEWTLYTEGWGSSAMTKYSDALVYQMYSPFFGYMPGWQTPGFCNYQNKTLDKLGLALANGNYANKAQRDEILRKLVELGIEESVRVFVVTPIDAYLTNAKVKDVVDDLQAGIANHWTEMIAYKPGSPKLTIAVKYVHQWPWNPVAGYQDLYSVIIRQGLVDGFMANNPYTGDKIPLLAKSWTVKSGNIVVPTSAITYDYKHHKWVHVKPGTVAKNMIILHLRNNLGVFHDGQKVRVTDMLYWVYLVMEWGTKAGANDTRYDPFLASVDGPWIQNFKGVQYIPPNTLVIYTDMKHFDPNELADEVSGVMAPTTPWELLYAMEQAVESGKVAFSQTAAQSKGVDWLDSLNPAHVKLVLSFLEKDAKEHVVPPQVAELAKLLGIKPQPNYQAVIAFIKKHGHMVIGNGPLYLDRYYPNSDSAVLRAFRNPNYPFTPDQFDYLAYSKVTFAEVKKVEVPPIAMKGQEIKITVDVVDKRTKEPLKEAIVFVALYGPTGNLVSDGFAKATAPGKFVFTVAPNVSAKLQPGTYTVKVIAYSKQAFWPSIKTATFLIVG
jgi:peptide/nickel transport system substrate-binding protein